jgi:hypothetical protein
MSKLNLDDSMDSLEREVEEKRKAQAAALTTSDEAASQEPATSEDNIDSAIKAVLLSQGLTGEDIESIKEKFGRLFVYPWNDEKVYVYRPLIRKEYNLLRTLVNDAEEMKTKVIERCVVFPVMTRESLDNELAGIQEVLSEIIFRSSGFINPEEAMAWIREI